MKSSPTIHLSGQPFERKLPSAAQMASFDKATIAAGTPGIELMERAGRAMSSAILNRFDKKSSTIVMCGPGNNGGDGFVVARELQQAGVETVAVIVTANRYSAECLAQLNKFVGEGGKCHLFGQGATGPSVDLPKIDQNLIGQILNRVDLVIDALLGSGQEDAPKNSIAELLHIVKDARRPGASYISIDLPTGIDATTGMAWDPGFFADVTLCVELLKRGMVQYPARELCGEIVTLSIGLDCSGHCDYELLTPKSFLPLIRPDNAHKGTAGTVLVLGGSQNMPGAASLSALASLRTGCGVAIKSRLLSSPEPEAIPEIILRTINDNGRGFFAEADLKLLEADIDKADAVVLGPGLGTNEATGQYVYDALTLLVKLKKKTVVDADALNLLAKRPDILKSLGNECVLTPHPGEAGRLLNCKVAQIQNDRYSAAKAIGGLLSGASVILKGAFSVVQGTSSGFVNSTGNRYMATAGSGDVLSGIIAAYMSQGLNALEAAKRGAFIHGLAGDLAHESTLGAIIASDLLSFVGRAENFIFEANNACN